jgi:hypothetical protein
MGPAQTLTSEDYIARPPPPKPPLSPLFPSKKKILQEENKQANLGLSPPISRDCAADSPNPMPRASGSAARPPVAAKNGKSATNPSESWVYCRFD